MPLRTLRDPAALQKSGVHYNRIDSRSWTEEQGFRWSPNSTRKGETSLTNVDPPTDKEQLNRTLVTALAPESADPARPPPAEELKLLPPSGQDFKARLLSRARWPESRNIEDQRGKLGAEWEKYRPKRPD